METGYEKEDAIVRRKEKEIVDRTEMEAVINEARVCRMGMCDGRLPYIVPLCFGYADDTFYCQKRGSSHFWASSNAQIDLAS